MATSRQSQVSVRPDQPGAHEAPGQGDGGPPTPPGGRGSTYERLRRKLTSPRGFFYFALGVVLFILVVYPIVVLIGASFVTGQPGQWGDFSLEAYRKVWGNRLRMQEVAVNSFTFGFARVSIGLLMGLLFAWAVARTNVVGRRWMEALVPIPFFVPDLMTGISWIMLGNPQNGTINQLASWAFGTEGPLINVYGWGGLVFHSSFSATAFIFILMLGFFYNMDPALEEAALASGAGPYKTVFTVTLPLLGPAIAGTAILSFIQTIESFENPLLFGTPAGLYVFANEIYRVLRWEMPADYPLGAAISVLLLLIVLAMLIMQRTWVGNRQYTTIGGKGFRPHRFKLPQPARWGIFVVFAVYLFLAIILPLAHIVAASFFQLFGLWNPEHLTLEHWRTVLGSERAMNGLRNTVVYSVIAGVFIVMLGALVGYIRVRTRSRVGPLFEGMAWGTWAIPGITMGLALLWAWLLLPPPFNLYGTAAIIIIGFIAKGLPLGTRTMQSAIMQVSSELEESARVSGASWLRAQTSIMVPLLRLGIAGAFVVVFALSVRDLTVPLLLHSPGRETLTVAMLYYYELGVMPVTAAVAVVQLGVVMAVLILERLTRPSRYEG